MLKTKVMSKKQTSLESERQSDLLEVWYSLKHIKNTISEINNNLPEVLGPILRYHHAQNQVYVK